ncbi:MAG TPA: flagellar basal body protein [Rhodocyclaceae bacterium]|nr:flagellar basal body protein [Rhodocyclaceae bacterium]
MSKLKLILVGVLISLLLLAAGGGAAWWFLRPRDAKQEQEQAKVEIDKHEYKYVSLEKVIVMLRGKAGEPMSHYLAVDLVFKTPVEHEKITKEHLPLLRSLAVKALSTYPLERASLMTVEEFATDINRAFSQSYAAEHAEKPFAEAMIGKLIIE